MTGTRHLRGAAQREPARPGQWDAEALSELDWHWGGTGGPYEIFVRLGEWVAVPLDDPRETMISDTADDLRHKIRVDYLTRYRHRPLNGVRRVT